MLIRTFVDFDFVLQVCAFNVHRGRIVFRDVAAMTLFSLLSHSLWPRPRGPRDLSFHLFLRLSSVKMNVIAKSTTVSPFLRATATVVSNGGVSVAATGKVHKPKVTVPPPVKRILGQSLYQDLLTGPTCISSGVTSTFTLTICCTNILRKLA